MTKRPGMPPDSDAVVRAASRKITYLPVGLERADVEQQACLAVLEAERTFNPAHGGSERRPGAKRYMYLVRAASFAVSRLVWRNHLPVSGAGHRPAQALAGLRRTSDDALEHKAAPGCAVGARLAEAEWVDVVRSRIDAVAPTTRAGRAAVDLALNDDVGVEAVARFWGVTPSAVKFNSARFRAAVAADAQLRDALEEAPST